jgi:type I restriction enzyme M protein
MLNDDIVEAVIGLGPNLFYNSPMEACLLVCRQNKPTDRKGKVLFINAVQEVSRESAYSFLSEEHIQKIYKAYKNFEDSDNFSKVVSTEDILKKNANLNISLYVSPDNGTPSAKNIGEIAKDWLENSEQLKKSSDTLLSSLDEYED